MVEVILYYCIQATSIFFIKMHVLLLGVLVGAPSLSILTLMLNYIHVYRLGKSNV